MLRLVSDWIWETDAQLNLLHMSNRVVELLGFHPRELAGQNLLNLAEGNADIAALEQSFHRHSPFRHQRCQLVAKNGELKTVLISAVPVFNFHSGALTGFRGTATDVTELRRREIGLQAAKEVAETANRAKTEFLASMSHELRTPLNAIIGFAEVMHMELLGPIGNRQYYGYVGDIHESARHLLNLINDILDVAKIEAGRTELHEAPLDIRNMFDSAARLIRERSLRAQVQLEISVDQGIAELQRRRAETQAGADQPAVQRGEVHARRRPHQDAGAARRDRRSDPHRRRHRHRHSAGRAGECDGTVRPGGQRHQPEIQRHRPGPAADPRPGGAAWRHA